MRILFKFATRSRPELFKRGMESIINNVASDNYHIVVSIDKDDSSMSDKVDYNNTTVFVGTSKNKIDAINRDMDYVKDWDILVSMSDDMVFHVKNFDDIIREAFYVKFREPSKTEFKPIYEPNLNQCLHFPDGNRNDLITMAIMGRDYYDRFGYIYHPDYKSLWCDNEMTEVAKLLGCYKYIDKDIVQHLHPAYGKAIFDRQYQHTESFMSEDEQTFKKRKSINFGI